MGDAIFTRRFSPEEPEVVIIQENLVLHFDASNNESYPGTGSTWFDLSNNGKNMTLIGSPSFSSNEGGYLQFNGSSQNGTINASGINWSTQQTIQMVIRPLTNSDSARRNPWNQNYGGYGTMTHEPNRTINYYHGTAGGDAGPHDGLNSGFTVNPNEKVLITLRRNTSNTSWFKNITAGGSKTNIYPNAVAGSTTLLIAFGYTTRWLGRIHAIAAYDRYLTTDEIEFNYNIWKEKFSL